MSCAALHISLWTNPYPFRYKVATTNYPLTPSDPNDGKLNPEVALVQISEAEYQYSDITPTEDMAHSCLIQPQFQ